MRKPALPHFIYIYGSLAIGAIVVFWGLIFSLSEPAPKPASNPYLLTKTSDYKTQAAAQGTFFPNTQQMTATTIIRQATEIVLTFDASKGTFYPTTSIATRIPPSRTPIPGAGTIYPTYTLDPAQLTATSIINEATHMAATHQVTHATSNLK
jgi:hypothetical protein